MPIPSLPLFVAAEQHAQNPEKIAVVDTTKQQSFTFVQLLADAAALRKRIIEQLGLTGDLEERRIAFLVPNGYDYVATQWAVWAAGGVCVPLCTSHPVKELLYTVGDSDPSLVIMHPHFEKIAPSLREGCPDNIPFMGLEPFSRNEAPTLPSFSPPFALTRRALMIYTSGTTSNPKGCVTTHENITFQASCLVKAWEYSPSDCLIHVLPLHHVHGIINGLAASFLSGTTVEMHPKFDPKVIWERWQDHGSSTLFMAVPTIYSRLNDYFDAHIRGTEREGVARAGARALRLVVSGSAALPTPIKEKFAEITGQVLLERYGMTEIGMAISCGLDVQKRIDGSVGWPLPGVEVRLTEKETGRIVDEVDEDGMIEVKGGNVFCEYWRKPEATASEFTADGWFKTGDVAKRDSSGAYFIQGRASVDLIKSGGYKISALEVERKMLAIDTIQEVAVVGLADQEWGQRVAAVVKFREGTTLDLPTLRAELKNEMAPYKIPTVLKVVDGIERNAMGKVNKKVIHSRPLLVAMASEKDNIPTGTESDTSSSIKGINEKALLRKLDYRLLPPLTLLYLLSFLDRSNVGNARLEGMTTDINMCLTLYFIGYVLFEIPCNIILKKTTPRIWLPTLTLAWGVVATLLGVVQNYSGYLSSRFFLGVAESGLFPGVVFYLSMWYKRNEQHYRVALFFSAASLAGAFGGILAWAISHMKGVGNLNGWRWIFILEGLLTIVVSIAAYFWVYNYPSTAEFLSKEEREFVQLRLKNDSDATRDEEFAWSAVLDAFKDPKVWLYGLGFHTMSLPLYTLSLFLPTIIKELGYSAAKAQLLSVPPYAVAFFMTIGVAIASEKTRRRAPFIMGSSAIGCIGYILLLSQHRAGVSYVGTIFAAAGIYPAVAIVLSWPANNVSGQTKRCIANAMQISIGNMGAVLGTQLYRTESSPRFFLGHGFALGYLVANIVVVGVLWEVLRRENSEKERVREVHGLSPLMGDVGDAGEFQGDKDPRWVFQT
ncbi:AMP-dependent synthetase/ligase [Penicillium robsamsonii]|uniref:AMP-dependent synthetase/ligase n=1 Tax=Penicillium robsamsonii TaxID=1792511 RepID=UPI002548E2FD|nr:AMP-dependent synthetase/ligase [Penicillium robsamsonii]KAJ5813200.1 AMP-dependent synthetase/ligase [Penicillium robsamsonii]